MTHSPPVPKGCQYPKKEEYPFARLPSVAFQATQSPCLLQRWRVSLRNHRIGRLIFSSPHVRRG